MSLVLVTAPAALVSTAIAKDHLKVETTDHDTLIAAQVAAATRWAEQYTGRAFMSQVWDYYGDGFPWSHDPAIKLPMRPVISITSITYFDTSAVSQTWAGASYSLYGAGSAYGASILPVPNGSYPSTQDRPEAVKVRFVAGYSDATHPDLATAKAAVLLIVGDLFANREAQNIVAGSIGRVDNPTARALLDPLRVWP